MSNWKCHFHVQKGPWTQFWMKEWFTCVVETGLTNVFVQSPDKTNITASLSASYWQLSSPPRTLHQFPAPVQAEEETIPLKEKESPITHQPIFKTPWTAVLLKIKQKVYFPQLPFSSSTHIHWPEGGLFPLILQWVSFPQTTSCLSFNSCTTHITWKNY